MKIDFFVQRTLLGCLRKTLCGLGVMMFLLALEMS
jgi:hypothetical protein